MSCTPRATHLTVSLFLCISRNNVLADNEGPWQAPWQLKKAFKRFETKTRELVGGTEENGVSPTRGRGFALQTNKWWFFTKRKQDKNCVSVCTCPPLMTYDEVYYTAAPLMRLKAPGCPAKWPTLLLVTHQIGSCCLQQFNPVIISVCWIHSWREAKKFREQGAASQKKTVTKLLISLLSPEIPLHKKCRDADPNAKALC